MSDALELKGIFQHVKGRVALQDIHLRLPQGGWLLVVGPNGAGKSLLMRLILGLDTASAGTIRVLGEDVAALNGQGMRRLRRRIGAVLQGGSLLAGYSVIENLLLPLRDAPMSRDEMARAARLVMTLLQLDGLENHPPRALSLGLQRRVELARALIHRPSLLIWDGFSDGLDPAAIKDTLSVLANLRENSKLTLIATDNRPDILAGADYQVAVLDRGRLLFEGTQDAALSASTSRLDLRVALRGRA